MNGALLTGLRKSPAARERRTYTMIRIAEKSIVGDPSKREMVL
jgi:hypothetical protein